MKPFLIIFSILFSNLSVFASDLEEICLEEAKTAAAIEADQAFEVSEPYGFAYMNHRYVDTTSPGIISYEIENRLTLPINQDLIVSVAVELDIVNSCEVFHIEISSNKIVNLWYRPI